MFGWETAQNRHLPSAKPWNPSASGLYHSCQLRSSWNLLLRTPFSVKGQAADEAARGFQRALRQGGDSSRRWTRLLFFSANMRISARMASGSSIAWSSHMTSTRRNTSFLCLETSLESTCSPRVLRSSRSINAFALSTRSHSDERTDRPSTLSLRESYCSSKDISSNRSFRPPSLHILLKWSPIPPIILQSIPPRLKTSVVIFPCPIRFTDTSQGWNPLPVSGGKGVSKAVSMCAQKSGKRRGINGRETLILSAGSP